MRFGEEDPGNSLPPPFQVRVEIQDCATQHSWYFDSKRVKLGYALDQYLQQRGLTRSSVKFSFNGEVLTDFHRKHGVEKLCKLGHLNVILAQVVPDRYTN